MQSFSTVFTNLYTIQSIEQVPTGPVKLTWRQGTPPPEHISGAAVVHGNTAYFSESYNVYSYTLSQDKWTKLLKQCEYRYFSMAVVNNLLTTIGGLDDSGHNKNTLFCFSLKKKWERLLPPMPTPRRLSAVVTTPTHLIVAGGVGLSIVETLDTNTLQWFSVSSLPEAPHNPSMTLCNGQLYISQHCEIFSCSVEELLKSHKPAASINSSDSSVWTRLAGILNQYDFSLTTLRGQVFAIGGQTVSSYTPVVERYNRSTNSWSVIGEMPSPRSRPLVAVLPSHELIVGGGSGCRVTEIASSTYRNNVCT